MQRTDLPIPLRVSYDEIGALSTMYEEDILQNEVAGDEIGLPGRRRLALRARPSCISWGWW
jgi:hypothetical protein